MLGYHLPAGTVVTTQSLSLSRQRPDLFPNYDEFDPARWLCDDEDLLVWVHCAEVSSYLETTVRAGLDLSPAEWDRYVEEQSRTAEHVCLDRDDVPRDVASLRRYLAGVDGAGYAFPAAPRTVGISVTVDL